MTRFVAVYSLILALSAIPTGLAGPACAVRHYQEADCVEKCKDGWGWLGSMMGTDRWGSVITKMDNLSPEVWETIIAEACGLDGTSIPSTTVPEPSGVSTHTLITQPGTVTGTGSEPAEFTSILYSISSSVIIPPTPSAKPKTSISQTTILPSITRFTTIVRPTPPKESPTSTKAPSNTKTLTVTQAPPPATTSSPSTGTGSGSTSPSDIQAYLAAHNSVRAQHGADPLVWSDQLASKAQQWANGCKFQHSGGSLGPFGENLAAGTGSSYGIPQAIKSWTDEVSSYNGNNPQPSHFTQVVWKGSQQLGCAVQECNGIFSAQYGEAKYYVCEYSPAGNVIGQFAQNVQV